MWHYLQHKKVYLVVFSLVGLIWAIEMSLSPYLLKVIIDRVVQYSYDHAKMIHMVILPCVFYVAMTLVLNLNFRLYDYTKRHLFPALKAVVKKDMFSYVLQHSPAFFQNTFAGNVTNKITTMADNIEPLISIPSDLFIPRLFAI